MQPFIIGVAEGLRWSVRLLRKLKVPFLVSGGMAVKLYGVKRHVSDIDIEISDADLKKVAPEIREYIKFGPERNIEQYFNELLIKLEYKGQEISLCGCDSRKIFNSRKSRWQTDRINLNGSTIKRFHGLSIPVIKKEHLIAYKKIVARKKDLTDAQALTKTR